ncbi:MAG TPA: choice-of-anchor D domain-containing protein [Syntrophales bacterium]|nr:choice-of-anchor D domain-containing protein [Syntrophales bacterium]
MSFRKMVKNEMIRHSLRTMAILFLLLFPLFSPAAYGENNKIVDAPNDAYSGTYIYQGTRSSTASCPGIIQTRAYYKHATENYYLYGDYMNNVCDFPNWFCWFIREGIVDGPGSADCIYWGWEETGTGGPEDCTYWADSASTEVTSSMSITDEVSGTAPTVSTMEATLVTTTSGNIGGNVVADGGASVTERGLVYSSTDSTPQKGEAGVTTVLKGTGTGLFYETIGSLTAGATYYYQAYGINTYGTAYGGVKSFTTPSTSEPNKLVSGITSPSGANGVYVWIGSYYGKPAWKHQSSDYWVYYSWYSSAFPDQYSWYIDDALKDAHGTNDYLFDHSDAATCPSSGWSAEDGTGTPAVTDYPQIEFTNGAAFSPGNPAAGTTGNPIGRFFLDADIAGASLTAVTIAVAGDNQGVSNLKLWSSSDGTFNSGSDTQLNSQPDGATVTFSGFSSSISTSGTYYFVTTDLATSASGSFTLTIGSKTDLTISGGAMASSFTNAALTSGEITIVPTTEINIKGNSVTIADGDTTPIGGDDTDFGSADIASGSVEHTFTIENLGSGTLSLTGSSPYVVLTGDTGDFTLTQSPSPSIPGEETTTFKVTFNPTTTGTRSATVSIDNDDSDENPYDFSIQGTGTTSPEMDVSCDAVSIADGSATSSSANGTDFGSITVAAGSAEHTFTVTNSGSATLSLTDPSPYVVITGATGDFTLTQTPSGSVSAGGGTTSFKVTFDPTTTGTRSAAISIANDDGDENPYNFNIQGQGITAPVLTTSAASSVSPSSATLGGNVTGDGGETVTERGVAYSSTDTSPEIGDAGVTKDDNGSGTGVFSESIGSLAPATTYYFQAYAVNTVGTSYGGVQSFTTQNTVSSIARSGPEITHDGSVEWTVTFAASMTGLAASNFSLVNTGLTGPSVTGVSGSGTTWTVTAVTGTGSGNLGLNLANDTGLSSTISNLPCTGEVYTIDKEDPLLSSSSPADDSGNLVLSGNIVLTFDDAMAAGTGNVTIRRSADHTIFEQIGITDPKITVSVNQVTVDPGGTLARGTEYYLEVDATALVDDAGNPFAGISGSSALNFTTVNVLINEIVTDPQTDWSTNGFTGVAGAGAVTRETDEWVELLILSGGIDLTGWTIELLDGSDVIGDLTNAGVFDVSNYVGTGSFTGTVSGDTLVLGDVDGTGSMEDTVAINLKDPGGAIVDSVSLGETGKAPSGDSVNTYDESVQRFPNGRDTDTDLTDFTKGQASMAAANTGPTVTLSVTLSSISENNEISTVIATLSAASSQVTTIGIATSGTAAPGTDYTLSSGTIVVPPGDLSGTATITSSQDIRDEVDETVVVDIASVTNGTEAGAQQRTVTITDDDEEPLVTLSVTGSPMAENGGTATVTATLSAPSEKNVTVNLGFSGTATPATDYTRSAGSITIDAGSTTGDITLTGADDGDDDDDETIVVDMTGGTNCVENGVQQVTVTIADDENPEIGVSGDGQDIGDGDATPSATDGTDFGNADLTAGDVTHRFTITNTGAGALHLSGPSPYIVLTGHTGDFTVAAAPSTPVAKSGGTTTFDITFNLTAAGLRRATAAIASDDADESSFTFDVLGTGGSYPEISVQYDGTEIADGDTTPGTADGTDFGQDHVNLSAYSPEHTFRIVNLGSATLNLAGSPPVVVTGVDFSLTQNVPATSIAAGGSVEFKVIFAATAAVVRNGTVSIASDDGNENPYSFAITGTGYSGALMAVQDAVSQRDIENGDSTPGAEDHTDFGIANVDGETVDRTFEIENFGAGGLNLTGTPIVAVSGDHAGDFTVTDPPASPIVSGANDTFTIRFDPDGNGLRRATVSISNDDPMRNPYTFALQGTGRSEVTLSGTVTDGVHPIEGATITFSHDGHTETSAADGAYSCVLSTGTTTTLTVSHPGYGGWSPADRQLADIQADQPGLDFAASCDADGVPTAEESGPDGTDPSYDGNGDGIPDGNQPNVVSLHTANGSQYVTVAAPGGTRFLAVEALPAPAPGTFPLETVFPYGLFRFTLSGIPPGGAVQVSLVLSGSLPVDAYWKYGREPGYETDHPYLFMRTEGGTGAEIDGNTVLLHFIDGGKGDDDLNGGNGVIVDDGGPACTMPPVPALSRGGIVVFLILLSLCGFLMRRRRFRSTGPAGQKREDGEEP